MQEYAPPRMRHLGEARRGAVTYFIQGGQVRVAAELEDKHHEHQERHEEMQAVKLRDSRKHKGDYRNAARGIAELAREKETCKHVEDPRRKSRRIDNGHNPLEVRHIIERRGATQMKHHDIYTR